MVAIGWRQLVHDNWLVASDPLEKTIPTQITAVLAANTAGAENTCTGTENTAGHRKLFSGNVKLESGNISTAPAGTENTYGNTKHLREQKTPKRERKHLGNKKHQSGNRKPAARGLVVKVSPAMPRVEGVWAFGLLVIVLYIPYTHRSPGV